MNHIQIAKEVAAEALAFGVHPIKAGAAAWQECLHRGCSHSNADEALQIAEDSAGGVQYKDHEQNQANRKAAEIAG